MYVSFPNGHANQAILLSEAAPLVKEIIETCEIEFDVGALVKQRALSRQDQQKALEILGERTPKRRPGARLGISKAAQQANKNDQSSRVPLKVMKLTTLKKRRQGTKRGVTVSAQVSHLDSAVGESGRGMEKLFQDLPERLHDEVLKYGKENGAKSVDVRREADKQKEMLKAVLEGSSRVVKKRLKK